MRVGIVIPARNEAGAIGQVLAEIPRDGVHEIVVVDNGSTDATAEVAAHAGARVVREPVAGYGRACLAGIAALDPSVKTVVFMDADHSDYPEELPFLLAPIEEGRADLVIGSRTAKAQRGSLTPQQRFGNGLACALMRWLYGTRYTDLGPFRAIRRDALDRLHMQDQAFGWTVEMQAKAARLGVRVTEVPVRYRPRIGRSKISGTVSGTVRAGIAILSTIVRVAISSPRRADPPRHRLSIFLKYPTSGQVKTRLAADLGSEEAAAIYRASIELTLARLQPYRQAVTLYVDPPDSLPKMAAWLGPQWRLRPQQGATLGDRLAQATRHAFTEGAQHLVIIGTDSPWLTVDDIDAAFEALHAHDLVLGPTDDGGYYLIGLSRCEPAIFEDIAWSTPAVYAQTMARAAQLGLRVHALRQRYDLDEVEDVERFLTEEQAHAPVPDLVTTIASHLTQRRQPCRS